MDNKPNTTINIGYGLGEGQLVGMQFIRFTYNGTVMETTTDHVLALHAAARVVSKRLSKVLHLLESPPQTPRDIREVWLQTSVWSAWDDMPDGTRVRVTPIG